jgi:large subunit ribosomal protein L15
MSLSLHTIKAAKGSRPKSRRIGRGHGSSKGTTAGKGTKGQGARTGGRNRRALRGIRRLMLSTPKLRGFKSLKAKSAIVSLEQLDAAFQDGTTVNLRVLKSKGLVTPETMSVKILGNAGLTKKLTVTGIGATASAKAAIEKAGGSLN